MITHFISFFAGGALGCLYYTLLTYYPYSPLMSLFRIGVVISAQIALFYFLQLSTIDLILMAASFLTIVGIKIYRTFN